jgi:hypothetical protein
MWFRSQGGTDYEAIWRLALTEGYRPARMARVVNRWLPGDPRCKFCYRPFAGVAGKLFKLAGFRQSRKNPQMCDF